MPRQSFTLGMPVEFLARLIEGSIDDKHLMQAREIRQDDASLLVKMIEIRYPTKKSFLLGSRGFIKLTAKPTGPGEGPLTLVQLNLRFRNKFLLFLLVTMTLGFFLVPVVIAAKRRGRFLANLRRLLLGAMKSDNVDHGSGSIPPDIELQSGNTCPFCGTSVEGHPVKCPECGVELSSK